MEAWLQKVAESEVPALQHQQGGLWCLCLNVRTAMVLHDVGVHAFLWNVPGLVAKPPMPLTLMERNAHGAWGTRGVWADAEDRTCEWKPIS